MTKQYTESGGERGGGGGIARGILLESIWGRIVHKKVDVIKLEVVARHNLAIHTH